ncbi:unnamed protein product [Protopolystoma xenopodis]|uniref:Uncharacterized protein n=1 Tax=Protopolystoma xenopodis TaxID=117903 RepID=A0A448XBN3_9PLAT|nr:unnamed protein product [Protopolystoma xenopodis]
MRPSGTSFDLHQRFPTWSGAPVSWKMSQMMAHLLWHPNGKLIRSLNACRPGDGKRRSHVVRRAIWWLLIQLLTVASPTYVLPRRGEERKVDKGGFVVCVGS